MAPLITDPRMTYRAFRVTVDIAGAEAVKTYNKRPVHIYRLDLIYTWGAMTDYTRRHGGDGQEWRAEVYYHGKMVKPSGEPGNTEVGGEIHSYQFRQNDDMDWIADLVDEYMPIDLPTSSLADGVR